MTHWSPIRPGDGRDAALPSSSYTDYWYNSNLSGRNEAFLNASAVTLLNGDGDPIAAEDAGGSAYNVDAVTATAAPHFIFSDISDSAKGGKKHLEGANYSFADGHVKWYKPEKIGNAATTAGTPTFLLQ